MASRFPRRMPPNVAFPLRSVYKIYSGTRLLIEMPVDIENFINGPSIFLEAALSLDQIVDKVTAHEYEVMYGEHLMPYYYKHPRMKMLEIGLGCTMTYGAGGSVKLWKKLFPRMDLWEAEYDTACVEQTDIPPWLHVLVGDQSDPETLDRWIEESGGNFDVIVDDGGHTNCQIMTSFEKLWPHVKPGGLYLSGPADDPVGEKTVHQNRTGHLVSAN